ncbi:hypothetical protein GGR51DRAFT_571796 [Nemania sp. FL0031]|nr:hypothetical protein GGR51DRAFT_571796 [Nemania sp. FL0031]
MPEDAAAVARASGGPTGEPLSCVTCRSRKLRCDKVKPVCTRCAKVNGHCVYPESRRKPAFKRRNVKELEERLAQVEDLLRQTQDGTLAAASVGIDVGAAADAEEEELAPDVINIGAYEAPTTEDVLFEGIDYGLPDISLDGSTFAFNSENPTGFMGNSSAQPLGDFSSTAFNGELIDLGGVFEALPPFEMMEDLNRLFFQRQQQFAPIIHPSRYLQAFYSPPHMKPPMCLQYAIWALASNSDSKYHAYHDIFYRRARQYADMDEMKGNGEHFITVAHAQTWCVIATDEAKSMMFTRAAMSCARAVRLAAMMGLHHLDSPPDESSPTLAPPQDWAELEERRRVFWGIFCIDSHCSISTGWPHLIDTTDVTTHLPATEAAFHSGEAMETCTINDIFRADRSYSSFAGSVVVCYLFNIILKHAHRPKENDNPENYEYGEYWKRHRDIDNTLSSAFMFLPEPLRLPDNYREPTAVNTNLNLHASIICLHHAALERIETHHLPESAKRISEDRLSAAAQEIVNIMKLTSHLSFGPRTPLAALSLFCAASVYIYFCKENNTPTNVGNLDFILSAMEAVGRTHSITRSFLRQALLDIERNGVQDIVQLPRVARLSRHLNNAISHNVPLLARTRMSRHSEAQPPMPGLPAGKTRSRGVPVSSTPSWVNPAQNSGAASVSSGSISISHAHKRQRVAPRSSNSSARDQSDVLNGSNSPFCYLPIRSDPPAATSNPYSANTSIPNTEQSTEPLNPSQGGAIDSSHNRIGVTIATGILGKSGPKPFATAGREASQTKVSKGGLGSWDIAGLCVSAMAGQGAEEAEVAPSGGGGGDDLSAEYAYPGAIGLDWDVLDTNMGVGASTSTGVGTSRDEGDQNADGDEEVPAESCMTL